MLQICNWFANWRRKLKNAAELQEHDDTDVGLTSWGRRILRYNLVAARNAEKIPVIDEDELLQDEDSDIDLTSCDSVDEDEGIYHRQLLLGGKNMNGKNQETPNIHEDRGLLILLINGPISVNFFMNLS
jgi:hypothetical protein